MKQNRRITFLSQSKRKMGAISTQTKQRKNLYTKYILYKSEIEPAFRGPIQLHI